MSAPEQWTVKSVRDSIRQGDLSAQEVTQGMLDRVQRVDPVIQAYVQVDSGRALNDARIADERVAKGEQLPLLGVPIGIKDVLNVAGDPCGCCSQILKSYISPYTATAIQSLQNAGAVMLGRMNMDEFAMGSSTENSSVQTTRNPWNTDKVPGGSSGGSAAAVSAGEAVAALGTDTGGSIRQPAAFCGCVGLKPTYGRISRYGLTAYASSLDQIGPLTKTVEDAALLMEVMAGHDRMDSTSMDMSVPPYSSELRTDMKGLTLGLPTEFFGEGLDADVDQAVKAAVKRCEELGATVKEVSLPHLEYGIAVYYIIATAEASANLARFDGIRYGARIDGDDPISLYGKTRAAGFGEEVKRRIILGTYVLSSGYYDAYYVRAQKARALIRQDFEQALQECDALLGPVTPTTAFGIGERVSDPLKMYLNDIYTVPVNLAGICALSLPCGFADGLPVGLQVIGKSFDEKTILNVGHAYEQACDWHTARPETTGGKS